ncbi:putative copia-type protein [Senna tora]|uniref:Putative copia-type protein n=1 Tax=Senna tora TaxID=362788 RepID=A0A834TSA5_9FABA|nr:putative copia-type protein [Senna tora]
MDILKRFDMLTCAPVSTPMVTGRPFTTKEGAPMKDPSFYRRAIGSLQYLVTTKPDIAFTVNKLSQFLAQPTDIHFQGVKRILRYLKGSFHLYNPTCQRGREVGQKIQDKISKFEDKIKVLKLNEENLRKECERCGKVEAMQSDDMKKSNKREGNVIRF